MCEPNRRGSRIFGASFYAKRIKKIRRIELVEPKLSRGSERFENKIEGKLFFTCKLSLKSLQFSSVC